MHEDIGNGVPPGSDYYLKCRKTKKWFDIGDAVRRSRDNYQDLFEYLQLTCGQNHRVAILKHDDIISISGEIGA